MNDPDDPPSVGPAPSPVASAEGQSQNPDGAKSPEMPLARPLKGTFRRHLPHFEGRGSPLFVTFVTAERLVLPPAARDLVLKHVLHDHGVKMALICTVVMPDHVHMLYWPREDSEENRYSKGEVVGAIKGASAHSVNKLLGRRGPLWLDESFDHVLRKEEAIEDKAIYICQNPVRRGLAADEDAYPWKWRNWVEGAMGWSGR